MNRKLRQVIDDLALDAVDWTRTLIRLAFNIIMAFVAGNVLIFLVRYLTSNLWYEIPDLLPIAEVIAFAIVVLSLAKNIDLSYRKEEGKDDRKHRKRESKRVRPSY